MQIARACELLLTTELAAEDIAPLCGFEQSEFMQVVFKRICGQPLVSFAARRVPDVNCRTRTAIHLRVLTRMALPFGIQGFTSCSGVQFLSKLVPGFLHECEHLGSAFVDSRFGAAVALADLLTDRHLLSESGQFRRDTDHRA